MTGRQKIGKELPGLIKLNFCCTMQFVGSKIGVSDMNPWNGPACVRGSDHNTTPAFFKCHSLRGHSLPII